MRFAYADPPYLGCGRLYDAHHADSRVWDDPETHRRLIDRLVGEYPDGWAMSLSTPSLRTILPMCPDDCRIGAWVKPFAIFKPNVNPAYAWEPVIWRGGRKRGRDLPTERDWVSVNITLKRGLTGAKPSGFANWLFNLLGARVGDALDDLFPGSNAISDAWRDFTAQGSLLNSGSGANRSETVEDSANCLAERDEACPVMGVAGTNSLDTRGRAHRANDDGAAREEDQTKVEYARAD